MAKQLNVNLAFNADTSKAKAQIRDLQNQLDKLITSQGSSPNLGIEKEIRNASKAAAELKVHLNSAINEKTGNIDFSKLNQSIQKSGKSLNDYGKTLLNAGENGRNAFAALANSVAQAEVPIRRSNALLSEMATTLKNTARWQLSSSILHGFMGSVQKAYGYAQDLNKSLNEIRIVSGQSADEMAKFAERANKAAKALSTSTTAYTDAALIYYQQGLDDQEIEQRTNVTIKMSNVTGEAVEDVSSYMTAVWNNFNKAGDQSVEHYADIMTKLGAETAASTEEIAAGLSKFSAVADTVGLSFEMASSAVTAIIDQTRESPEVVGTALKTIFSRIEGLKQGETLEDGVDYNKYSQGLKTVGIDIKDATGNLKDMDVVLKEIGAKWDTIDREQQIALAQTVAGTRQYSQFIALFDNWDKVEENLMDAANATGTLGEQADIYAESWEAAKKRVQASLQTIYTQLIKSDDFIGLLDGLTEVLDLTSNLITGMGGLNGVLVTLGAVGGRVFHNQLAEGLRNTAFNLRMSTEAGREYEQKQKSQFMHGAIESLKGNKEYDTTSGKGYSTVFSERLALQQNFIDNQHNMSEHEQQVTQQILEGNQALGERLIAQRKLQEQMEEARSDSRMNLETSFVNHSMAAAIGDDLNSPEFMNDQKKIFSGFRERANIISNFKLDTIGTDIFDVNGNIQDIDALTLKLKDLKSELLGAGGANSLANAINFEGDIKDAEQLISLLNRLQTYNAKDLYDFGVEKKEVQNYISDYEKAAEVKKRADETEKSFKKSAEEANNEIKKAKGSTADYANGVISLADGLAAATSAAMMFKGALDILNDPDVSGFEKFLTFFSMFSSSIGMAVMSVGQLKSGWTAMSGWMGGLANSINIMTGATKAEEEAVEENTVAKKANEEASEDMAKADVKVGQAAAVSEQQIRRETDAITDQQRAQMMDNPLENGMEDRVDGGDITKTIDTVDDISDVVDDSGDIISKAKKKLTEFKSEAGKLGKALDGLMTKIAPVIGIAAVLATVAGATYVVLNENRIAAERAAKAYEGQAAAEHELKLTHEAMNQSISNYKDLTEDMNNLTRGTEEWTNNLMSANDEVMKLLQSFPLLAQYISTVNGKLTISEAGFEFLKDEMARTARNMATSTQLSQANMYGTKNAAAIEDFGRTTDGMNVADVKAITDAIAKNGNAWLNNADSIRRTLDGEQSNRLVNAIIDNREELVKLTTQLQANEQAEQTLYESLAQQNLVDDGGYKVASNKEAIEEGYSARYEAEINRLLQEGLGMSMERVREEYARQQGASDVKTNAITGETEYLFGETWKPIEDAVARRFIAAEKAAKSLEGYAVNLESALNKLHVGDYLEGQFSQMTKSNIQNMDYSQMSIAQLGSLFESAYESSFTDEEAKNMGYVDAEEMKVELIVALSQAFKEAYTAQQESIKNASTDISNNYIANNVTDAARAERIKSRWDEANIDSSTMKIDGELIQDFLGDVSMSDVLSRIDYSTMPERNEHIENWYASSIRKAKEEVQREQKDAAVSETISEENLNVQGIKDYAKELMSLAETSDNVDDSLKDNATQAKYLATSYARVQKGVQSLKENFKSQREILDDATSSQEEYQEALAGVRESTADLLDIDDSSLSDNFFKSAENLDLLEQASQGSTSAIEQLRVAAAEDILLQATGKLDVSELDAEMQETHNKLADWAAQNDALGKINVSVEDADFIDSLNQMIAQSGMTAEQVNAYLGSMGYEAEVTTDEARIPSVMQVPVTTYSIGHDPESGHLLSMIPNVDIKDVNYEQIVQTPQIKSLNYKGSASTATSANVGTPKPSTGGKKSGGGGGGGGKKSTPAKPVKFTKKSDVVDRYKEEDDILDDIQDKLDDITRKSDRLYGKAKLQAMEKEADLLLKQKDALQAKADAAKRFLDEDKQELKTRAAELGVNFNIDDDTNLITNYTEEMEKLYKELNALEHQMNGMSTKEAQDEFKEASIVPVEEKIETIKDLISQFDDTRELYEDLQNQVEEAFNAWQDKNYEKLQYQLELKVEINDAELQKLDYFLNKYSDNFYKMAESVTTMNSQIPQYKELLATHEEYKNSLDTAYENNEISQADYIEGLKEVRDGYYENLEALNELDKEMLHFYEDTLSEARNELEDFTDHMEHLTSVFDHYLTLTEILGKQKDYDLMSNFLGGKADTIKDRLDTAKSYYDMLLVQKEEAEAKLNAAIASGDESAAELYREEWDAIVDEVDAAQEEVLSLTETWAEAMKAVIENNMAEIAENLERTLSGGLTFDILMDGFDKLNTRQEEYLTKTNKIYETNKLMRTASKALDETDNKVAKQKLANFIEETKNLQQNTKLSQYELDIQKAKYDLLLAQIALEEAQNAKNTVRLSRDSEGNFGYVYTADQDTIDDAAQGVDDAENNLYNISLKGQQDYTAKYLQSQQQMLQELEALKEAHLSGEVATEEEYNAKKALIMEHYYGPDGILTTYQNLYNVAVRTDADATADYWAKDYGQMTQNTADWANAVQSYWVQIEGEIDRWKQVSQDANRTVENALDDSATATKNLTDESEKLKDTLIDTVVPAIKEELDWVADQTEAYAAQRAELERLIDTYERYTNQLDRQIADESNKALSDMDKKGYDKNTDYNAVMASYLAQHGEGARGDATWNELEAQRQAKIKGENIKNYTKTEDITAKKYYEKEDNDKKIQDLIKKYDTGGYTGEWGPEGKLAILHEKELVLNKKDTENLLNTISFIREIANMIDSQASIAGLFNLSAVSGIMSNGESLEQTVTIHAEFPNATNHSEIEEAFNNLINTASQYANRKK